MENLLKVPFLEQVFKFKEVEMGEYTAKYNKEYEKETQKSTKNEKKLSLELQKAIKDEKGLKKIQDLINDCEGSIGMEGYLGGIDYYKFGFFDGINFAKEVKQYQRIKNTNEKNSIMYEYIEDLVIDIQDRIKEKLTENEDYMRAKNRIQELRKKYPKIEKYIVDEEITELNNEELKALLELIKLKDDISAIEINENFKVGIKEGKLL